MELYVYGLLLLFSVFPISDSEKVYQIAVVTDDFFIKKNSYSKFTGHIVDIIKAIAKDVKFKYKFYEVADGKHGEIDSQGNWNGLIGELQKGRADMIAAPMSINLEREKAVQFVTPFLTHGLTLLVKKEDVFPTRIDDRPPKLNFFLLPFEVSLWIMIIISGFMVAGYLSLMNRFNPYEKQITEKNATNDQNRGYNPFNSLWYTFTILFLQGYGAPTPKSIASRIVIMLWWFISFFLAGFYLSGLVDLGPLNQTGVPTLYPKFKDIESAYMASIKMGVVENSPDMAKEFFDKTKIARFQKIKKELVLYKNMNAALAAVANGTDLGLITDSLSALRFASGNRPGVESYSVPFKERCTLAAVGGIITERHLAFAGPLKNFDLKNQLDLAILQMKENQPKRFSLQGILGYSACQQYTVGKDTYYPVTKENQDIALSYGQMKVDLKSTGGLFLLLLFGFIISSAVFVGEVMYYRSFSQGINDASNRLNLELEEE